MDQSGTTTKAFRIPEDLKVRIEEAQGDQAAVDFWETILSTLAAVRTGQAEKPTSKEAETVRRALAQVEQVVLAALRLADETRSQAEAEVGAIRAESANREQEAREEKKTLEAALAEAKEDYRKASEEVTRLLGQAENVAELKSLWKEKEAGHLERIAALDTEAMETRRLKETLAEVRAELVGCQAKTKDLEHALDLQAKDLSAAQTEAGSLKEALADVKAEMRNERESSKETLDGMKAELDAERQANSEIRAELAAAKAQVEGLRETGAALQEAQQKDRQALEDERQAHSKTQIDLATAMAQAEAVREVLERERVSKTAAGQPDTPAKTPAASGSRGRKPGPS